MKPMLKNIGYFFIIFLFTFSLNSEEIENIIINGNSRVSDETVKIYGEINDLKKYSEKDANKVLRNLFDTGFFENVEVEYKDRSLIINLKEYPTINQLVIIGEKSNKFKQEIRKLINSKEQKSLNQSNLTKDINLIKNFYSSMGYNFAKVEAKLNEIDKLNYDLLLEIERGEKTKISKINFIGNNSVRTKRLKSIIASEENKFWKVISNNTVLSYDLIAFDKRLFK